MPRLTRRRLLRILPVKSCTIQAASTVIRRYNSRVAYFLCREAAGFRTLVGSPVRPFEILNLAVAEAKRTCSTNAKEDNWFETFRKPYKCSVVLNFDGQLFMQRPYFLFLQPPKHLVQRPFFRWFFSILLNQQFHNHFETDDRRRDRKETVACV